MTDQEAEQVLDQADIGRSIRIIEQAFDSPEGRFWTSFSNAQSEFGHIARTKTVQVRTNTGPGYTFSYAPLETILKAVVPALNANGLALTQKVVSDEDGPVVVTTLADADFKIENRTPLFGQFPTGQAFGSAVTYARRMGVTLLLCVAADDDDDGNAAAGNDAQEVQKAKGRSKVTQAIEAVNEKMGTPQTRQTTLDREPKAPEGRELERAEGRIVDAVGELLEAASEGRSHGITQVWDEIKTDTYVAGRVWQELQKQSPNMFKVIKGVLRPEDSTPHGPKAAA